MEETVTAVAYEAREHPAGAIQVKSGISGRNPFLTHSILCSGLGALTEQHLDETASLLPFPSDFQALTNDIILVPCHCVRHSQKHEADPAARMC